MLLKKITEHCWQGRFQIYNHVSKHNWILPDGLLPRKFVSPTSEIITPSLLSSSFQHSFLSAPLSTSDLALYITEKRDAIGLERPHLSTNSSPAFLYLYSNTMPSFLLKREEDRWDLVFHDWIICHCLKNIALTITHLCFIIAVSIQTWLRASCKVAVSED